MTKLERISTSLDKRSCNPAQVVYAAAHAWLQRCRTWRADVQNEICHGSAC